MNRFSLLALTSLVFTISSPVLAQGYGQQYQQPQSGYPQGYEQAQTDAYRGQAQQQNAGYSQGQPIEPDTSNYARQQAIDSGNNGSSSGNSPIKPSHGGGMGGALKSAAGHIGRLAGKAAMPAAVIGGTYLITKAAYPYGMPMGGMGMPMGGMGMMGGGYPMGGYGYGMPGYGYNPAAGLMNMMR